jgi:hypothetical protein
MSRSDREATGIAFVVDVLDFPGKIEPVRIPSGGDASSLETSEWSKLATAIRAFYLLVRAMTAMERCESERFSGPNRLHRNQLLPSNRLPQLSSVRSPDMFLIVLCVKGK